MLNLPFLLLSIYNAIRLSDNICIFICCAVSFYLCNNVVDNVTIRIATVVYLHHTGANRILEQRKSQRFAYDPDDPLQPIKVLGLNLGKRVRCHEANNKKKIRVMLHLALILNATKCRINPSILCNSVNILN